MERGFWDPAGFCSGDVTEGKIRFYREVRPLVNDSAECREDVIKRPWLSKAIW